MSRALKPVYSPYINSARRQQRRLTSARKKPWKSYDVYASHRRSSCLYASRRGGPFAARRVINSPLLGDGVPGHPAEIHVQIAVEYVSEFVPCPARLPRVLFTELFTRTKCDKRAPVCVERLSTFSRQFSSNFRSPHYFHFRTIDHTFLAITVMFLRPLSTIF